jgi:hypothetical protein
MDVMIGQFPKQEARKPVQAGQTHLSIMVTGLDSIVIKLCERSDECCKSLVCDGNFVIGWY